MNWHRVPLASAPPSAWRNGGGTTRELLTWPHGEGWEVRVSVADVERSGPFSEFAGVTRWFAVLSGGGVKLDVDGTAHLLDAKAAPLRFNGAAPVQCELAGGATQDFNLMLRGREGSLQRVNGGIERACRKGSLVGVYSHEHEVAFRAVEVRIVIPPRTLAWQVVALDGRVDLVAQDALWFEVQP